MDKKKPVATGTEAPPENPELENLLAKEKNQLAKIDQLEKMDAAHFERQRFDLMEVKRRAQSQLAEIRSEIKRVKDSAK